MDESLEQQALDASQKALDDAQYRAQTAVDAVNAVLAGNPNADTKNSQQYLDAVKTLDAAKAQLAKAESDHAGTLARIAAASRQNATKAADPNQQKYWAAHADQAEAQADVYRAEAATHQAKTDADIQKAQAQAQAALERANSVAQRVGSQNDRDQASAFLNGQKAAQIAALTPTLVQQHAALTNKYLGQAQQSLSQSNLNQARADYITGPQAEEMYAKGELTRQQADFVKASGGAKIDDLVQKAGLNAAKADQLRAKLTNPQLVATEPNSPTRVTISPQTGELSGQANPGYVNPQQQALSDYQAAVKNLQDQIANGQIDPKQADLLMQGMQAATQARIMGTDILSYQKQQEDLKRQQLTEAQTLLNNRLTGATDMAKTLWDAAQQAAGHGANLSGIDLGSINTLSRQYATEMLGGQQAMDQARQLVQGLGPVQNPMDLLTHMQTLQQAQALLQQARSGQRQDQNPPQAAAPAPAANGLPAPNTGGVPLGNYSGPLAPYIPPDQALGGSGDYAHGDGTQPDPALYSQDDPTQALLQGAGIG